MRRLPRAVAHGVFSAQIYSGIHESQSQHAGFQQAPWIVYRYAETLLTYAESMIEAFGDPDYTDETYLYSARWASIRLRANLGMPDITVTGKTDFHCRAPQRVACGVRFRGSPVLGRSPLENRRRDPAPHPRRGDYPHGERVYVPSESLRTTDMGRAGVSLSDPPVGTLQKSESSLRKIRLVTDPKQNSTKKSNNLLRL